MQTMGTLASAAMAIAMIAVFLLIFGGVRMIRGREFARQGWLMLVAALVLFGNVLVWTV